MADSPVRDLLLAEGKLQPAGGDVVPSEAQIIGVLRGLPSKDRAQLDAAHAALDQVDVRCNDLLDDKVGSDRAVDLKPLNDVLRVVAHACGMATGGPEAAAAGGGRRGPRRIRERRSSSPARSAAEKMPFVCSTRCVSTWSARSPPARRLCSSGERSG